MGGSPWEASEDREEAILAAAGGPQKGLRTAFRVHQEGRGGSLVSRGTAAGRRRALPVARGGKAAGALTPF